MSTVVPSPRASSGRRAWLPWAVAGLIVAIVAAYVAHHAATSNGPVLPLALCRAGQTVALLRPLTGARFLSSWQVDPAALAVVVPLGLAYAIGVRRHRRQPDGGRPGGRWPVGRSVAFGAGLLVIVLATSSAIAVYDMTLFTMHMIGHLMLVMLAPALLAIGRPLTLLVDTSAPARGQRITGVLRSRPLALLTSPPVALATYAGVIVGTHLTGLMGTVMQHPWAGQVEHLAYLIAGFQFFTLVFGSEPLRWRLSVPGRLMLLAMSMAVDTFVGLVLLQSSQPIAMLGHPGWGPSALADTQAGGAIMWAGGDGLMAVLAISLFVGWAQRPDELGLESSWFEQARRSLQAERRAGTSPAPAPAGQLQSQSQSQSENQDTALEQTGDIDEDEAQWRSYNEWLQALQDGRARP